MTEKIHIQGTLIPIGGNEDKGISTLEDYSLDFVNEGILSHVVRESGGSNANIVVIPTASSIPIEVGDNYMSAFDQLGASKVHVLDIRSKAQSENQKMLKHIEEADCVMFSGGDQSRIVDIIGGSRMHDLIMERYLKEDFVVAGTSAGAMCMSTEMISGGKSAESFFKGAVHMRDGMGFVPQLIIDSHFIQRGRFGRLAESVAKFPDLLGVGLAEDTGIIIKNCNECRVIGSGMVIIMDPSQLMHNNERLLDRGTPMTLTNMIVHVLSNSDGFSISDRKVEVLPMNAEFI